MKKTYSIGFVAFAAAALFVSNAQADNLEGECTSIVATALGSGQACYNFGCYPNDAECFDVGMALLEFFMDSACGQAFATGELNGLGGNAIVQPAGPDAGGTKHLQEVICSSIAQCGLCDAANANGICPQYCL